MVKNPFRTTSSSSEPSSEWSRAERCVGGASYQTGGELFDAATNKRRRLVNKEEGSARLLIAIIICFTVLLLAAIGSWLYVQHQNLAQRDRALQQQKQLKEYEQSQINNRQQQECRQKAMEQAQGGYPALRC